MSSSSNSEALLGRAALVTGGSRGIGREIALAFGRAGADVVVGYHTQAEQAEAVAAEIRSTGAQAATVQVDVSDRNSVRRLVSTAVELFDAIDVLVNNAGVLQQKAFMSITDEDWDDVLNVNLKGTFICSQEVLAVMDPERGGRIINLASSGGQLGGPLAVHYSASKAGVISLTRSLARIGAPGIAVNCISPGLIETEMTQAEIESPEGRAKIKQIPLERAGTAVDVSEAALYLATTASYVTGQTINVNGGLYLG